MNPNFPIIIFYNNSIDLLLSENKLYHARLLGILKGNLNSIAYDSEGNKWDLKLFSEKVKNNFFIRFLAYTFYNPKISVIPKWNFLENYDLIEIKKQIITLIENDDDIYTQFVTAEELRKLIENANNFKQIFDILLKCIFKYNEE